VAPWRRKFSKFNVLFICYGTAVEHRSLLNRSGIRDGIKHGRQNITLHWINGIIRNNKCIFTKLNAVFILKTGAWTKKCYNVTNTWLIQQTPMFHGCTITHKQNVDLLFRIIPLIQWSVMFCRPCLIVFGDWNIYPVCFPNIYWHSGLNNQWKYV
jgi:hypothetical protein